jgi:hypothetical protein
MKFYFRKIRVRKVCVCAKSEFIKAKSEAASPEDKVQLEP